MTQSPAIEAFVALLSWLEAQRPSTMGFVIGPDDTNPISRMSIIIAAAKELRDKVETHESYQSRVKAWMLACFGEEISSDKAERNHRFLEEALELVQSIGCTQSEARNAALEALKPCPFCGTYAEVVHAGHIRCGNIYNCDAETRLGLEAWNRRAALISAAPTAKPPMKIHFDNETLKTQIEQDGDEEP